MGKAIEAIAKERGHSVLQAIDENAHQYDISEADVCIDFSIPTAAVDNLKHCFDSQVPVVCGTTGWLDQMEKVQKYCEERNGGFIYASNFSLGVNLFFELNAKLAKLMSPFEAYDVKMEEIHHTKKLDAPSGTAITLAQGVLKNHSRYKQWKLEEEASSQDLAVTAKRLPDVPGTHSVTYFSEIDEIEIKHTAHSRKGFALGAVLAAEWLAGKQGIFTMKDVLGLT